MKIRYAIRSSFTEDCENTVRSHAESLNGGSPVVVNLKPGGYSGQVKVDIIDGDPDGFCVDWKGSDPTRFPARIKAAATALYRCKYFGKFLITHANGKLTIRRI